MLGKIGGDHGRGRLGMGCEGVLGKAVTGSGDRLETADLTRIGHAPVQGLGLGVGDIAVGIAVQDEQRGDSRGIGMQRRELVVAAAGEAVAGALVRGRGAGPGFEAGEDTRS